MTFPDYVDVDYQAGVDESPEDYPTLRDKIERATEVLETALLTYHSPAVMWTGGKDSTLTVYFLQEVARQLDEAVPRAIFIDHFQHFPETRAFVDRWEERWDLEVIIARNDDVGSYVDEHDLDPGDPIPVEDLNEHNRRHVREVLEYEEEAFPFLLDTYVGNHLLKTVALNEVLESHEIDGVISGVRWDEQAARSEETFFSPRHDPDLYPPHDRVHPILPFTESDVWEATWRYLVPDTVLEYPDDKGMPASVDDLPTGVSVDDLPVASQYFEGYRSLGSAVSTEKTTENPAWIQDLEATVERAGRAQDKEDLMERLRELGYM